MAAQRPAPLATSVVSKGHCHTERSGPPLPAPAVILAISSRKLITLNSRLITNTSTFIPKIYRPLVLLLKLGSRSTLSSRRQALLQECV